MLALAIGIVAVHRIPAFMDRGLDATLISFATAVDAVCAGAATYAFGMLMRRFSGRLMGSIGFALLAVASVLTIYATTTFIMFLSMAVFGLGIGGMMFLQNFIWADYFGRANVGSIRGLVMPINLAVGGMFGTPQAPRFDMVGGRGPYGRCYGAVGNDAASARAAKDLAWLTDRHIGLTRMRCYLIYSLKLLRDNC